MSETNPEVHTPEIESESVSQEPEQTADTGPNEANEPDPAGSEEENIEESVGQVPDGSVEIDTPDIDLATHSPPPEETQEAVEAKPEATEPEAAGEVEEHPDLSKEDYEKEIAELKESARIARERTEYWTAAKKDARAAHFQRRDPAQSVEETPSTDDTPPVPEPPTEGDFENYNDYVEALTDYKVDRKMAEYDAEAERRKTDVAHAEKRGNLIEKLEQGQEKFSDFDEMVNDPIVPITEGIIDILAETEYPAEIAYHLAKNLSLCTKISRMAPEAAAVAIGNIEAKISADAPETPPAPSPKPKVQKTTTAPAPISPVKPGGSPATKDMNKMSNEEYRAHRRAGQKK